MFLLSFFDFVDVLPFLFAPLVFVIFFVVCIVVAIKRIKAQSEQKQQYEQRSAEIKSNASERSARQREYLEAKRRELEMRKRQTARNVDADDHSHSGNVEKYDKIVGSLGEVDDEGCEELDGVRLIEHDESYCDDPDHLAQADLTNLEKAIVLGDVINNPRFKSLYNTRKR